MISDRIIILIKNLSQTNKRFFIQIDIQLVKFSISCYFLKIDFFTNTFSFFYPDFIRKTPPQKKRYIRHKFHK